MVRRFLVLTAVTLVAASLQARSLYWPSMDVAARLDADGRLHVSETQTIVFDGDWNGGERQFRLRPGESMNLVGISRIDHGQAIPLKSGDLSAVDAFQLNGNDLRWRSRLPSDPPFSNTALTYRIDYIVTGALRREGSRYELARDFAFPQRDGNIEQFALRLDIDPAWSGPERQVNFEARNLLPGQEVIVRRNFTYVGAGTPAAVAVPLPRAIGYTIAAIFIIGIIFLIARFVVRERATGRFAPLHDPSTIDEGWLRQHLFSMPPEEAGAAWDRSVGAAEVAAVLARMAAEKKIESSVDTPTGFFKKTPVLHLKLLVPRTSLREYELSLVDKLFFDDRTETDTNAVRDHYKRTGLDLASLIRPPIETQLDRVPNWKSGSVVKPYLVAIGLVVGAGLLLVASATQGDGDLLFAAIAGFSGIALGVTAAVIAGVNSPAITALKSRFTVVGLFAVPAVIAIVALLVFASSSLVHAPTLVAIALWGFALLNLILYALHIKDGPEKIAFRKTLAAAREYFIRQLKMPQPRLSDDWLPYLLAFGLGQNVDRWFRTSSVASSGIASSHSSFGSSSSIGSSASGWTGGGGAFGGAGATGAWTVAAGALAAGVASPGSSGGGGGGGSAGGGGGGGGW